MQPGVYPVQLFEMNACAALMPLSRRVAVARGEIRFLIAKREQRIGLCDAVSKFSTLPSQNR